MERPNVVFILTDDQGIWALGCYGNPEIRTPNIDSLAESGLRLTNFFCTSPVCSPARASLMTGMIPSRHGVHDWIRGGNMPPGAVGYLDGFECYTDVLARDGYVCGLSGKWHLGDSMTVQHGFSHWFAHQKGSSRYNNAPMVSDGKAVDYPGYITDGITDDAVSFIENHRHDRFYLSVHYTAPHFPWSGHPQEIMDSYEDCPFESCPQEPRHPNAGPLTDECMGKREKLKGYFSAVTAMDAGVGRIVDKLETLNLREKTLVVFTSDNGYSCGHNGFWGKGNGTFPLNMYDNSVKVPMIFNHRGSLDAGKTIDAMTSQYDFMPTLLDYLKLPLPGRSPERTADHPKDRTAGQQAGPLSGNQALPGKSFLPALRGEESGGRNEIVVFDEYGPVRMIRTREWKYIHRYPYGPHELFNLEDDPKERNNLIERDEHRETVESLRRRLADWFALYVDPAMDGSRFPVNGCGQADRINRILPGEGCFFNDRNSPDMQDTE